MRKFVALAAVSLAASLTIGASTASADYWRKCGSQPQTGAGWYYVKAHNISCRKARRVARRYQFDRTPFGFSCQSRPTELIRKDRAPVEVVEQAGTAPLGQGPVLLRDR